jgi:hypothetical protein
VNYFTFRQIPSRHVVPSKWEALMRGAVGIAALVALTVAGIAGSLAGIGRPNNEQRVLEATVQMERLATKLAHAKTIAPETKLEIARLTQHPWYDCNNQVACRAALEARNSAARARLQTILAGGGVRTLSENGKATHTK